LTVHSPDFFFENLRVDVVANGTGEWVEAWTTWRGNEWENRGERRGEGEGRDGRLEVRALGAKAYYQERTTCKTFFPPRDGGKPLETDVTDDADGFGILVSVTSIFKNPMILIAIFTLGMVVGMPYLMENSTSFPFPVSPLQADPILTIRAVDPETKAEFEEMQKKTSGGVAGPASSLQNRDFAGDFASWMAGKPASSSGAAADTPRVKRRGDA
jgi:hypothetical protein